jgi:hypothetical protein
MKLEFGERPQDMPVSPWQVVGKFFSVLGAKREVVESLRSQSCKSTSLRALFGAVVFARLSG